MNVEHPYVVIRCNDVQAIRMARLLEDMGYRNESDQSAPHCNDVALSIWWGRTYWMMEWPTYRDIKSGRHNTHIPSHNHLIREMDIEELAWTRT